MNNEIGRKITSLTLMAIMVAGGMSFAIPGMEPAFAANEHLTVSAETVGNFAGIQVIEVVVNDPDRSQTDESEGIPNVEINGDDLLMVQGDDGAWYGYFANELATGDYTDIASIYGVSSVLPDDYMSGTSADKVYLNAENFLDGTKSLQGTITTAATSGTGSIQFITPFEDGITITIGSLTFENDLDNTVDEESYIDINLGTSNSTAASVLTNAINNNSDEVTAVNSGNSTVTISAIAVGTTSGTYTIEHSSSIDGEVNIVDMVVGVDEVLTGTDNNPTIESNEWPFIQTYEISDNSDVTITYGSGSTAQKVVLTYDYDDSKDISLDREKYPADSQVFLTLDDSLLNLSPTGADIWSFGTNGEEITYYVEGTPTTPNIQATITDWAGIGFKEGPLIHSVNTVTDLTGDNGIRDSIGDDTESIIFKESNDNDNIFVNYDNNDESTLVIKTDPSTGSAVIEYNDSHSIIADTFNGLLAFLPVVDEWLSGVPLDISLTDEDSNLNTRSDEILDVLTQEVPYIVIGKPLTIEDADFEDENSDPTDALSSVTDSKVGTITVPALEDEIATYFEWPNDYYEQITNLDDSGDAEPYIYPYLNYDLTNVGGSQETCFLGSGAGNNDDDCSGNLTTNSNSTHVWITFALTTDTEDRTDSIYVDVFFFGQEGALASDEGYLEDNIDRVNDAIYRLPLEETSDDSGEFIGTVEYIMINQLNVFDTDTYDSIETNDQDLVIIVNDDMDGADAITVSFNDTISTGKDKTISDQEDANTQTGVITLDSTSYSQGNTVTITLSDSDLNTDSDTIQIYGTDGGWIGNDDVWLSQLLIGGVSYTDACGEGLSLSDTGSHSKKLVNLQVSLKVLWNCHQSIVKIVQVQTLLTVLTSKLNTKITVTLQEDPMKVLILQVSVPTLVL